MEPPAARSPSDGEASPEAGGYLSLLYDELRRIAAVYLNAERPDITLQPTALVHEAYLRLARGEAAAWRDEGHFRASCALAMRRILTDEARRRRAAKRGGDRRKLTLTGIAGSLPATDVVPLDDALTALETRSERHARIVELRFLGGLTVEQAAQRLGVSVSTAEADWRTARAWLLAQLRDHA